MSAGHEDHNAPAGVSSRQIEKYLNDQDLLRLVHRHNKIDREYDLPYLAGYSEDGRTIYLDCHLPEIIKTELDGHKFEFDPTPFLVTHESWEKALIDRYDYKYAPAHQVATKMEHRQVLAAGIPISIYDGHGSKIAKYIKAAEHEKIKKVPPDLDLTPYRDNKRLLQHLVSLMGRDKGKDSKPDAEYTEEGTAAEHCGPVEKWPKGACCHYITPNECEKVGGYIVPRGWCKHWERK